MGYHSQTEINRYFLILNPESSLMIYCPIQPGALAQRYSIDWRGIAPHTVLFFNPLFFITQVVSPSAPATFRCSVGIEHMEGIKIVYASTIQIETKGELDKPHQGYFVASYIS